MDEEKMIIFIRIQNTYLIIKYTQAIFSNEVIDNILIIHKFLLVMHKFDWHRGLLYFS